MENKIFIFLIAIFFALSLKTEAQNNDYATINIYRPPSANLDRFPIFINGNLIAKLSYKSKLTYKIFKAGKYEVMTGHGRHAWPITLKSINISLGEKYYLKLSASSLSKTRILKLMEEKIGQFEFNKISINKLTIIEGEKPVYANNTSKENEVNNITKQSKTKNNSLENLSSKTKIDVDYNIPEVSKQYSNKFALIIGNEDYSSYQMDLTSEVNVDFAENDAKIFKEYANKTLGIPNENIIYLINAKAIEMNRAIEKMNLIAKNLQGESELILYYAGHGFPDVGTKEPYLMPVDVSGSDLKFAVKLKDIYTTLTEYPTKRVTIFIDACFSGGARNQGLLASRGVKIKPKDNILSGNLIVFTASSNDQSALSYKEKKHGMFTYFLLKKLQDTKGILTYGEFSDYLKRQVSIKSVMINSKEQNPKINISSSIQNEWKNWKMK